MATALIEFLELGVDRVSSGGAGAIKAVLGASGQLAVTTSPTASLSRPVAPAVPPLKSFVARVSCLVGSIAVTWGDDPTATEAAGVRVDAGQFRDVLVVPGTLFSLIAVSPMPITLGSVSASSPALIAGDQAPLSLNGRGALRTIAQAPDGTDLDPAAPTRTAPYATGTMTVAAAAVGTATPAAPVASAVVGGPKRRKIYNTGTTTIWYGPLATLTADVGAATSGIPLLAGASDDLEGYTGEIYVRGAAAGSVGIRTIG